MQMGDTRLKGWAAGGAGTLSGQGEGGESEGEGGRRDVSEGLSMDVMMADR